MDESHKNIEENQVTHCRSIRTAQNFKNHPHNYISTCAFIYVCSYILVYICVYIRIYEEESVNTGRKNTSSG